jgi:hypothetical protein
MLSAPLCEVCERNPVVAGFGSRSAPHNSAAYAHGRAIPGATEGVRDACRDLSAGPRPNTNADLAGEGAATLSNARARAEIKKNGGPDIGISGAQPKKYESMYNQYKGGKLTRAQAERKIGQAFGAGETTSNTKQNYRAYYSQYYVQDWNKTFPNKPSKFRAP